METDLDKMKVTGKSVTCWPMNIGCDPAWKGEHLRGRHEYDAQHSFFF
jgi:hypothetical protein